MDLLIKGMEIPTDGRTWCLVIGKNGEIRVPTGNGEFSVVEGAKAIQLPPHGRLIDANAFEKENAYYWGRDFIGAKYEDCLCDLINEAPTIIPADKEVGE